MITPIKFLSWILGIVFTFGIADSMVRLTYKMGQAAIHAHKYDQKSYSRYNQLLWSDLKGPKKALKSKKVKYRGE